MSFPMERFKLPTSEFLQRIALHLKQDPQGIHFISIFSSRIESLNKSDFNPLLIIGLLCNRSPIIAVVYFHGEIRKQVSQMDLRFPNKYEMHFSYP